MIALTLGPLLAGWGLLALILARQDPQPTLAGVLTTAGWIVARLAGPPIGGVLAVTLLNALLERLGQVRVLRPRLLQMDAEREELLVEIAKDIVFKMIWLGVFASVVFLGCYLAMMIEGCA